PDAVRLRIDRGRLQERDAAPLDLGAVVARRREELGYDDLPAIGEGRQHVVADVADVAGVVAVGIFLSGVRRVRTVVDRIADRVAVGVGLHGVGRAGGTRARALLVDVAGIHRRAADGGRGLEPIGRADRARARAVLGHVADPGRAAADRGRGREAVARTVGTGARA